MGRYIGITWLLHIIMSESTIHSSIQSIRSCIGLGMFTQVFSISTVWYSGHLKNFFLWFFSFFFFYFLVQRYRAGLHCRLASWTKWWRLLALLPFVGLFARLTDYDTTQGAMCGLNTMILIHFLSLSRFFLFYFTGIVLGCDGFCIGEVENARCVLREYHKCSIDVPVD